MADGIIRVGYDVEGISTFLNSKAASIMGQLQTLRRELAPLIEAWRAQSATAYEENMVQWDQSAIELFGSEGDDGVLGIIAHAMNINWGNYVEAEQANLKTWQH